jgi:transcriptional regulator with XRE-family HTH domain
MPNWQYCFGTFCGGEKMEFLNNIAAAIDKSGKTRYEIAHELGITYNHLWRLLSGKCKMKAETIAELAIIINKTPNELYGSLSNSAGSTKRKRTVE